MYFQRRRGTQVLIYYRAKSGALKTIPRKLIRFLDHEPDHNVRAWIRMHAPQWEQSSDPLRDQALRDNELEAWVDAWRAYRERKGHGSRNTLTRACHALKEDVIPYFLSFNPPLTDANTWGTKSFGLAEWQEAQGISEANRIHANTSLRKWWKWLGDTRRILPGVPLPLDSTRRTAQPTTLAYTLTPDDVLKWVRATRSRQLRLMALLGYFASLRPQELFALRRKDFAAGPSEAGRVMERYGHFGRFAVDISRQRRQDGSFHPPKAFSKGVVAIFNEQAATLIREHLLREKDPEALLLGEYLPGHYADIWSPDPDTTPRWRERGIPNLTLHDLRKASIYWLGHHGGVDVTPLKNHARHAKVETTMLYCRRPTESIEGSEDLAW